MRICYLADASSIHTQRWVNYFAGRGNTVHLISYRTREGYNSNVRLHLLTGLAPLKWKISRYPSAVLWLIQIRRLIRRIQPDVLDAHFITVNAFLGIASGFHPLILTAWGSDILIIPKRNPLLRFLTRYALKKADGLICASPLIAEEAVRLGADRHKIVRMSFGSVDANQFSPEQREEEVKQKLGIGNAPIVMSTRCLSPTYSVDTLIRAIPLVLREVPKAYFIIIGDGPQKKYLQKLAEDLRISNSIKFLGWISHNELAKYLASSDIYVSTSLSDGASVSLLEAMACRLTPVVTDIPANRRWITEGENGFLVPINDVPALAERIVYLLQNNEARERCGKANREIIKERAEYEKEMAEIGGIYQKLVKTRNHQRAKG